MRATNWSPPAAAHWASPKRVSPRITPLTSASDFSSARKSPAEIVVGNATASTSSRSLSAFQPPAPMMLAAKILFLLVATPTPCPTVRNPRQTAEARARLQARNRVRGRAHPNSPSMHAGVEFAGELAFAAGGQRGQGSGGADE